MIFSDRKKFSLMRPPPSFSRVNVPITCSRECRSSDPSPCVITRGFNGYGQCVCVGSLDCMNYFKWSRAGFFVEWRSELETDEGWVKQASLAAIDIRCENIGRLEYSRTVVLVLSTCNNEASRRWASFFSSSRRPVTRLSQCGCFFNIFCIRLMSEPSPSLLKRSTITLVLVYAIHVHDDVEYCRKNIHGWVR